nr:formin-like protein 5 [Penaeus vannamei]
MRTGDSCQTRNIESEASGQTEASDMSLLWRYDSESLPPMEQSLYSSAECHHYYLHVGKLESSPKWSSAAPATSAPGGGSGAGGAAPPHRPGAPFVLPPPSPSPPSPPTPPIPCTTAATWASTPAWAACSRAATPPSPPPFSLLNHTVNNYMLPDPTKSNLISQLF